MIGAEALLRWEHPERGLILPGEFMAFIKQSELIVPIGLWVLREARWQAARWQLTAPEHRIYVSVNLSDKQSQQPNLADKVTAKPRETGLSPECLVLEPAESCILGETRQAIEMLRNNELLNKLLRKVAQWPDKRRTS